MGRQVEAPPDKTCYAYTDPKRPLELADRVRARLLGDEGYRDPTADSGIPLERRLLSDKSRFVNFEYPRKIIASVFGSEAYKDIDIVKWIFVLPVI